MKETGFRLEDTVGPVYHFGHLGVPTWLRCIREPVEPEPVNTGGGKVMDVSLSCPLVAI